MMKFTKKALLASAVAGLLASSALAADSAKIGYDGYADANYNLDLNAKNGAFALNQFGLDINASDDSLGIKGVISLVHSTYTNTGAGVNVEYVGIDQAYADKSFFDGMLEAKIGRFYTLVGYEVVPAPKNANETSSLLFNNEPVKHDGVVLTYNPLKSLSVSGFMAEHENDQLYGEWTSLGVFGSDSYGKDFGAQADYTLGGLNLIANYYYEPLLDPSKQYDEAHLINGIASYKVSDSLSFAGEYLYRTFKFSSNYPSGIALNFKDQGYSLYSTYTLGSFSINPRFTQVFYPDINLSTTYDGNYMIAVPQTNQYTLTLKYAFGSLTTYLEGNVESTPKGYEVYTNGSSSSVGTQSNVLIGANYQF